jgi:hypothetical protein
VGVPRQRLHYPASFPSGKAGAPGHYRHHKPCGALRAPFCQARTKWATGRTRRRAPYFCHVAPNYSNALLPCGVCAISFMRLYLRLLLSRRRFGVYDVRFYYPRCASTSWPPPARSLPPGVLPHGCDIPAVFFLARRTMDGYRAGVTFQTAPAAPSSGALFYALFVSSCGC